MAILTSTNFLFLTLSVFMYVFVFWSEGKRDGFDKFRLFDLIFTLLILSGLMYVALGRWFITLQIYHYNSVFLKFDPQLFASLVIYLIWIAGMWFFGRHNTWSMYRLLDVFTVSQVHFLLGIAMWVAIISRDTKTFMYFAPYYVLYLLAFSKRGNLGLLSGVSFALVTAVHATILIAFTSLPGRLPIGVILLTISVATIYFRRKATMTKTTLPQDFLNFIKNQLRSKEKDLQRQESLLKAEDPYLQQGRTQGNAEDMDEAILEDGAKEIIDARLGLVRSMRVQIKRALSFLKIGKYGFCEICGQPIDKARLKVYPEATTCVEHSAKSGR